VFVFLDESHRIKGGRGRTTADTVLSLCHLPAGKLLMSGTPMPQSLDDLVPQFAFLYPECPAGADDVVSKVRPVFVRTTKGELGLPPVKRVVIPVEMRPAQRRLYDLMKDEVVRQAEAALTSQSRHALRVLGRSVMHLLQVVSNPPLLAGQIALAHRALLEEVLGEGDSPKFAYACGRARQLARDGRKCIIWTTFRQNVEALASRLEDLNAVFIHGGIDAGSEDDLDTREGRIRQFHRDPSCFVLVANPAAAAEGISLHKVCHHAIYVERTFNAAHYLQSEDRIHRLGLRQDEGPVVEIIECTRSIDQSVRVRLDAKVTRMAKALNDPSLVIDPVPLALLSDDDGDEDSGSLDVDDVRAILAILRDEA